MGLTKGRNSNENDKATVSEVAITAGASSVLLPANPNRIYVRVDGCGNLQASFVKLQPAATDNELKGIYLAKNNASEAPGRTFWEMTPDNRYTGEISGISVSGNQTVCVTEY